MSKRADILKWMAEVGTAVSAADVAAQFDISPQSAFGHLSKMLKAGEVQRPGRGKYIIATAEGADTGAIDIPVERLPTPTAVEKTAIKLKPSAEVDVLRKRLAEAEERVAKAEAVQATLEQQVYGFRGACGLTVDPPGSLSAWLRRQEFVRAEKLTAMQRQRDELAEVVNRTARSMGGQVPGNAIDVAKWIEAEVARLRVHADQIKGLEGLPDGLAGRLIESHGLSEKLIHALQDERDGYINKLGEFIKRLQRAEDDLLSLRGETRARVAREEYLRAEIGRLAARVARADVIHRMERRDDLRIPTPAEVVLAS